jgi:PAS domain S-box-containing protein
MVKEQLQSQAATRSVWPDVGSFVVFELGFVVAYRFGMSFTQELAAPFWFPDAVMLCGLLLSPPRLWLLLLAGTLPIRLFLFVPAGTPLWFLLTCFVNDSLKAWLSAFLLRRLSTDPNWFESFRRFITYVLIAVVFVPALSAFGGAAARTGLGDEFWQAWKHWFLGDALAILVCAPFLILVLRDWRSLIHPRPMLLIRLCVLAVGFAVSLYLAFQEMADSASYSPFLLYLPLPFLLWAAVDFGPSGASLALFLTGIFAIFETIAAKGPFQQANAAASLMSIQLFVAAVSLPIMLLAALSRQQRRTDLALRESEERFRSLIDTAPIMVWMSGPNGLCDFFNKPWLDFTGRPFKAQLGNGWTESVHSEDRDDCVSQYLAAFAARKEFTLEYRLRRHDGVYRWIHDNGVPRWAADGAFLGYLGSCVDLTDRKEAEERLRELTAQLIHAAEAERYRIGQELHDDLAQRAAALALRLGQLVHRSAGDKELAGRVAELQHQAEEMCEDISSLSHELGPATIEKVDLLVALRMLSEQSSTDACPVALVANDDLPTLGEALSVPLYRVAQEALRNAIRHSGATQIEILLTTADKAVSLSVKDDGCGFIIASQGRSGLGLSGMTERMKRVGGTLELTSRGGQGTVVTATVFLTKTKKAGA